MVRSVGNSPRYEAAPTRTTGLTTTPEPWHATRRPSSHWRADAGDEDPEDMEDRTDTGADVSQHWERILQELRVTQTGTQIISGFLLSVAFQPTFRSLPRHARVIYLALVVLACAATLLGLLPVVQHRKRPSRDPDRRLVTTGSRILVALLLLVTLLAVGVAVFVFDVVLGVAAAWAAGGIALAGAVAIWAIPAHSRIRRTQRGQERTDEAVTALSRPSSRTRRSRTLDRDHDQQRREP